ncbi:sigma 54 modulation/S30EA ribosomal C-terminal domain-containing protein [Kribbella sp. NPDC000426]|uniref:sigma 54 modulation/S30EA ribosomal C-terminal domain-containing protein n=1 Tax=Kribbella sp. NPDC000426 TaxID=3154255 RepID=UPI00331716BE
MTLRGRLTEAAAAEAATAIIAVLSRCAAGITDSRLRLTGANCADGPGMVQVSVVVYGVPARVQVTAPSLVDAAATAATRLERLLSALTAPAGSADASDFAHWPHPKRRPLAIPFPGHITRLKVVKLQPITPATAIAAMHAMDYNLHLFTDADTGEDAAVCRRGPAGHLLIRQHTTQPPGTPVPRLVIDSRPAAALTTEQAARRLTDHGLAHIFYTNQETGRGNVLYRRYDGNLGNLGPDDE